MGDRGWAKRDFQTIPHLPSPIPRFHALVSEGKAFSGVARNARESLRNGWSLRERDGCFNLFKALASI